MPPKNKQAKAKAYSRAKASMNKGKPVRAKPTNTSNMVRGHAAMIMDPCNAKLCPCVGRGDSGIMQKFSSTFTIGTTAAATAGVLLYSPGANTVYAADLAATTTTATIAYSPTNAPGATMLTSNAADIRAIGTCIEIMPLVSEANRCGFYTYGNVSIKLATQGQVLTVDNVTSTLPVTSKIGDGTLAFKWCPGTSDDLYSPQGAAASPDDSTVMAFAWGGYPAAGGFRVKITTIVEWRPKAGMGMVESAAEVSATSATLDDVKRYLFGRDANWWWNTGKSVFSVAKQVASFALDGAGLAALAL